jgi:hypothetical protein
MNTEIRAKSKISLIETQMPPLPEAYKNIKLTKVAEH